MTDADYVEMTREDPPLPDDRAEPGCLEKMAQPFVAIAIAAAILIAPFFNQ